LTRLHHSTMIRDKKDKGWEMQIRKTYNDVNPELLYDEIRDFTQKQGAIIGEAKLETYSLPSDSSSFISRGTLTFKIRDEQGKTGEECVRAHVVGSAKGETKLMLDIDEKLFPQQKIAALRRDLASKAALDGGADPERMLAWLNPRGVPQERCFSALIWWTFLGDAASTMGSVLADEFADAVEQRFPCTWVLREERGS